MPCYEQFVTVQKRAFVPLPFFPLSRMSKQTGIYYIDSTSLPVSDNHRIHRQKPFAGLAARGKASMGWFFGFKLYLVFNNLNEIVACKLTGGQVHDNKPVSQLTKHLLGKLVTDKGDIGKQLAHELLRHGPILFTRMRKNMKSLPLAMPDKLLLNAYNLAETIIGSIKEFSSLNLPKHHAPINAFLHLLAALPPINSIPSNPLPPSSRSSRCQRKNPLSGLFNSTLSGDGNRAGAWPPSWAGYPVCAAEMCSEHPLGRRLSPDRQQFSLFAGCLPGEISAISCDSILIAMHNHS
jgi:DDE family transposase